MHSSLQLLLSSEALSQNERVFLVRVVVASTQTPDFGRKGLEKEILRDGGGGLLQKRNAGFFNVNPAAVSGLS